MISYMSTKADLPNCLSMFKPSQIQGEFQCIYCGQTFQKQNALRIHLGTCKQRALRRDFQFKGFTFHVYMNPRRDVYLPLKEFAQNCQDEPKLFLGALDYLKCAGWVTQYLALKDDG